LRDVDRGVAVLGWGGRRSSNAFDMEKERDESKRAEGFLGAGGKKKGKGSSHQVGKKRKVNSIESCREKKKEKGCM